MIHPITIVANSVDGYLRVEHDGRYAVLSRDEALWTVATILMGQPSRWLRTQAEYDAAEAASEARRKGLASSGVDPDLEVKGGAL